MKINFESLSDETDISYFQYQFKRAYR